MTGTYAHRLWSTPNPRWKILISWPNWTHNAGPVVWTPDRRLFLDTFVGKFLGEHGARWCISKWTGMLPALEILYLPYHARMATTHILYLHGFRSSPASKKAQAMAAAVKSRMPEVVWYCPALSPSPERATQDVMNAIEDWPRETMTIVGSSLGGFYATFLAEKWGCKAVLLNPAIRPSRDLAHQLGELTQWHDPEQHFVFETKHVDELQALEIAGITRPERYFAVIAKGDEVLDWKEMTGHYPGIRCKLLAGGDHALSDFEAHMNEIFAFMQRTP